MPYFSLFIISVLCLAIGACKQPCEQLAELICDCELTEYDQSACRQERVYAQKNTLSWSSEQQEQCQKALETCTCDALDRLDYAQCALTPP